MPGYRRTAIGVTRWPSLLVLTWNTPGGDALKPWIALKLSTQQRFYVRSAGSATRVRLLSKIDQQSE